MKKTGFLVFFVLLFSFAPLHILFAEDVTCGSSGEDAKKIDEILQNQKKIMDSLEELKADVNTVKLRVSSR